MRKVFAMFFMTLDGVAEFPLYPDDWPSDPAEPDFMWSPYMEGIDTLFLGARSYTKWHSFWPGVEKDPKASAWAKGYSQFTNRVEKVVFSKSLPTADWPHSRLVRGPVAEEIARLKALPGGHMALGGGPRLLQSFLDQDLVDDLLVTVFPSTIRHGKPLFRLDSLPDNERDRVPVGSPDRHDFRTVEARALSDGAVVLHYERAPAPR
jgi:dihydrofolate reductase